MDRILLGMVLIIVGGVAIATAGVLTIWTIERTPPVDFLDERVITPEIRPGDRLLVEFKIFRHRNDCRVVVDRLIFDGQGGREPLADEDFEASPGPVGEDSFRESARLPKDAAPGQGVFRSVRAYRCNPLQRSGLADPIIVRAPDAPFTILPPNVP